MTWNAPSSTRVAGEGLEVPGQLDPRAPVHQPAPAPVVDGALGTLEAGVDEGAVLGVERMVDQEALLPAEHPPVGQDLHRGVLAIGADVHASAREEVPGGDAPTAPGGEPTRVRVACRDGQAPLHHHVST